MDASARAAQVARDVQKDKARQRLSGTTIFPDLGVMVRAGDVIRMHKGSRGYLGPLLGACAGVMDIHPPSGGQVAASVVFGGSPRVGTIFVAVADGSRHERALQQGNRAAMHRIDQQIAQFNALADAAGAVAREPQVAQPVKASLTHPEPPDGLSREEHITWLDSQIKALLAASRESLGSEREPWQTRDRSGVSAYRDTTAARERAAQRRTLMAWRKELVHEKKSLERAAQADAKSAAKAQRHREGRP